MLLCQRKCLKDHYFFIHLFLLHFQMIYLFIQYVDLHFAFISLFLQNHRSFPKNLQPRNFCFQFRDPPVPLRVFLPLPEQQIRAFEFILAEIFINSGDLLADAVVNTLLI